MWYLFRKSCPNTQQQNVVDERKYRHILEIIRTFLIDSLMPIEFWLDGAHAVVYTIHRLLTAGLKNKTPFEVLFQREPDYSFLKRFGCACFPNFMAFFANEP